MGAIFVVAEHLNGELSEITFEMLGMGRALAEKSGHSVHAVLIGGNDAMLGQLGAADSVITVDTDENFNPETYSAALKAVVDAKQPTLVMIGNTSMGMDLAGTLSAETGMPIASSCSSIEINGNITVTAQLFGGKINVTSDLGAGPAVITVQAGSAPAEAGKKDGAPSTESVALPDTPGKVRFKKLIMPEAADVDITTQDILVAIGRGIGSKDDIEVAEELAEALDAAVAASRPIIDAGWLPKSRQVGKSGLKVKPKVYLALGISGAPEHIEGMKSSATIIAVNTDKNAPIFDVAHYGMVADLFDVCEELTEALE